MGRCWPARDTPCWHAHADPLRVVEGPKVPMVEGHKCPLADPLALAWSRCSRGRGALVVEGHRRPLLTRCAWSRAPQVLMGHACIFGAIDATAKLFSSASQVGPHPPPTPPCPRRLACQAPSLGASFVWPALPTPLRRRLVLRRALPPRCWRAGPPRLRRPRHRFARPSRTAVKLMSEHKC